MYKQTQHQVCKECRANGYVLCVRSCVRLCECVVQHASNAETLQTTHLHVY